MNVQVIVSNTQPVTVRELLDGLEVTRCAQLGRLAATSLCPSMIAELSTRRYDILHLHLPDPMGVVAYLAAKKPPNHRLVVSFHSEVVRQRFLRHLYQPFESAVLRRAAWVLVGSPDLALCDSLKPVGGRCKIVPFGIDVDFVPLETETPRLTKDDRRLVLAVGRLVYYKGFDFLIEAMSNVDGQLAIIGNGPLRAVLQSKISKLGLSDRVKLLGELPDVELAKWYRDADVFCLPSIERSEAFGLVQLEAMAHSLPIVNTRLGTGVNFVSPAGESGLTVEPRDSRALATALTTLLDDPTARARLGAAARERVRSSFSADVMARTVAGLYQAAFQPIPPPTP